MKKTGRILLLAVCLGVLSSGWIYGEKINHPVATFSIAAHDPATGELGVAVASRFFAVGSVVPWAKAGVGAIATQAYCNTSYGPKGLEMLAAGLKPAEVLQQLQKDDPERESRQVGIVDATGHAVTFTGKKCNT
jgi:uncharacterized Ntn-hydrolase superfamily protein